MLGYAAFLRLGRLLGGMSALTPQLKKSVGGYARGAERYLLALQEFADGQRLYTLSSEIAAEVQKLLVFDGKEARGSSGKARDACAVGCVGRVQEKVGAYLAPYAKTYAECEAACRQIAVQAAAADGGAALGTDAAGALLSLLRTNAALKPYYAQLVGMVGVADLRAVFERVLPQAGIGGAV